MHIDRLLETVNKSGASDVYLVAGRPATLRIHGELRTLEKSPLRLEDLDEIVRALAPERNRHELDTVGVTLFAFAFGTVDRYRVCVQRSSGAVALSLRRHPQPGMTLDDIGLPHAVPTLLRRRRGLLLVTGPAGSGRTTTLAAMLRCLNEQVGDRVMSIVQPTEEICLHAEWTAVLHTTLGVDAADFADALHSVANNAADVVALNGLEEPEHIVAALAASDAGRLVLATMSPTGAAATIHSIIDAVPISRQEQARAQLARNLLGILSQVLVRKKDGSGRVVAYEFLAVTPAVASLIRENQLQRIDAAIQTGSKAGMQLLDEHLWQLYTAGIAAADECIRWARDPVQFQARVEGRDRGDQGSGHEDAGPQSGPDNDDGGLGGPIPARPKPPRDDASGRVEPGN